MTEENFGSKAFRLAVLHYKPWHQTHWNSADNDPFPQLISGGLKHGAFDLARGAEIFGTTEKTVEQWANGAVPDRKVRQKVWKILRQECGILKSELPSHCR